MNDVNNLKSAIGTLQSPKATANQKAAAAKVVAQTHARYNVPYMGGAGGRAGLGLLSTYSAPRRRGGGRSSQSQTASSTVTVPAARGTTVKSGAANLGSVGGRFRVKHRELFHSLKPSSSAYEVQSFEVNPGLNEVFPWLSGLAHSFDQYRIVSWKLEFVPSCGTDEPGAVYLSWDPDPTDDAPTTKSQQANSSYAISSNVWKSFTFPLPSSAQKFTRSGSTDQSLTLYDHGQLHLATDGTGTNQIGDLYVTYEVELIRPHVFSASVQDYWVQHIADGASVSKNAVIGTLPFTFAGRRVFHPDKSEYSSNVLRLYISDCPSYEASGVREWLIGVFIKVGGTGAAKPSITSSASSTAADQIDVTAGGNTYVLYKTFKFANDPTGTYILIDVTAWTTVTSSILKAMTFTDDATFI